MAKTRDEAEIQTFLSPSGYKYTSGTERIRSYRLWQIINSDAANIMIEPEFKVKVLSGQRKRCHSSDRAATPRATGWMSHPMAQRSLP